MIDEVTAGAKVKLREKISESVPAGSIATILYIDDLDNVFIRLRFHYTSNPGKSQCAMPT